MLGLVGLDVRLRTDYGIPSYESSIINFISLQFFIYNGNYHRSSTNESKWLDLNWVRLYVRLGSNYGIPSCEYFPIYFISLQFFIFDGNYHGSSTGESRRKHHFKDFFTFESTVNASHS